MEKKSVLSHINESILAFSRDYSLEEATYDNTNATEEQIAEFEKSDERVSKIIELLQKRNRTFGKIPSLDVENKKQKAMKNKKKEKTIDKSEKTR